MIKTPLKAHASLVLAAGFFVMFVSGGARFAIGLTLKPMVDDLGWARSEIGLAAALFYLVSAVCTFWAGRMSDRTSPRLVAGVGLLVSATGIGLMSVVSQPWQALVLYGVLFAIGGGLASNAPISVMVTRVMPGRAGLANAIAMAGVTAGQLVMIAGLTAVLVTVGWRFVYLLIAGALLVVAALLDPALPPEPVNGYGNRSSGPGLSVREAAKTRQFWLLMAVFAICGFDDFFVATHVVAFAQDNGVDTFLAGNLLALMGLTGLFGVLGGGVWGDRAGPAWPTAASFAIRVCVFGLVALDRSPLSVAVFALVFGMTFFVTAPLSVLFVRDSFGPRNLGALNGLITMVHQIAGGLGAYIGAAVFDASGRYDGALSLLLVLSVVATVLTLCLRRPKPAIYYARANS